MREPAFCKCENKGADQLRSNSVADQRLYFRYIDTPQPLYNTIVGVQADFGVSYPICVITELNL